MASFAAMASSKLRKPTSVFCVTFLFLLFSPLNLVSARLGKSCHGFHTAFFFSDFSSDVQKLTLSGDAKLVGSDLQISGSRAFSAGGVFYSQPIRFSNPFLKAESKSFSSFFSFSMDSNKGAGIAFVIAPSKEFSGRNGPWLGLSDNLAHTVAIEFDTSMDVEVQDPSGNHDGFDLESLVSLATAEVSNGFSLKEGEKLYAWIDYIAPMKVLEVRLSRSVAERPESPIVSYNIDLANVWQEEMFVGFSSSTGNAPQNHVIYSWSFITKDVGMRKDIPRFRPGFFGPHNWGEHGPRDWHHGPHDWHHGPRDWHHGPGDWHHGRDHEGFPYWPGHDMPNERHPDHFHPHRIDDDGSWFLSRKHFTVPVSDVKVDANGYQKLSTTEADGKTELA